MDKKRETWELKETSANSRTEMDILQTKLKAGKDFYDCTVKLKDALNKGEMKTAVGFITRRTGLIATMDALDRRLARYPKPLNAEKKSAEIQTMKEITDQINEQLKQAFAINQECEAIAAGKLDELTNGLSAIHKERMGLRGYSKRAKQNQRFLSIKT